MPPINADQAVHKSYVTLPKWIDVKLDHDGADASAFDATGTYLAVFRARKSLMIWDSARSQEITSCMQALAAMESALGVVAVGGDGTLAATMGKNGIVHIWEASSGNEITHIESSALVRALALSNDDRWLAPLDGAGTVRL